MIISLIANTSIQYFKFSADFKQPDEPQFFREIIEGGRFVYDPIIKCKFQGEDLYCKRRELITKEKLSIGVNTLNKIDNVDFEVLPEHTIKRYANLNTAIDNFKNKWIPLPVFVDNSINNGRIYPLDWVRCYIEYDSDSQKADITIAIDTTTTFEEDNKISPYLSLNHSENIHTLCTESTFISDFIYHISGNGWIEKYLEQEFFKNEDQHMQTPFLRHIASYILLIQWLNRSGEFPKIQLFNDKVSKIPVDLVIDIGNSATCALLYEKDNTSSFDFNKIKKLTIQDYSNPKIEYTDSFPMNLIFNSSNYGNLADVNYFNKKFTLPSIVRIGHEAKKLINANAFNLDYGYELRISSSSPKRYLWDDKPAELEWQYKPTNNLLKNVSLTGITDQLKNNGELKEPDSAPSSKALYSRKSLMKFAFLEIITHAYIQINSFVYRKEQGSMTIPRTIDKIVISCPTSMSKYEQIQLRKAAEEACILLENFFKVNSDGDTENLLWLKNPEVIPSSKDVSCNYSDIENRANWNYDEATCAQMVFLYTLLNRKISSRFIYDNYVLKNKEYFSVGSIDFGAGTTDVVINQVNYKFNKQLIQNTLKLKPVFSDSFKIAGDDLIKHIIHKMFLESGKNDSILEVFAEQKKVLNYSNKVRSFFGPNADSIGSHAKINRKSFVSQICIPFALKCLEYANNEEIKSFKLFELLNIDKDALENLDIIKAFNKHFDFEIENIDITIDPSKVNQCVGEIFNPLLSLITEIFNYYGCDYIVISGKPASLNALDKMVKSFAVNYSNSIININNYWLGNWYPFADENGIIKDSKTVVTMGAMISFLSEKYNLIKDFNIDTSELIKYKFSNADYIFFELGNAKHEVLSPKKNQNDVLVNSLPFTLKAAKKMNKNYPSSSLFSIEIDKLSIKAVLDQRKHYSDIVDLEKDVNEEVNKILMNLPLKINIERDYNDNKEGLSITSIENREGDTVNKSFIKLRIQTMEQATYWMDTCEFNF
jgi:hypothetical protein